MGINFSEKLEFIIVTIIFTCCSLFGWISLILNPSILNNLFKRVDPGAGLLPVIILSFISLSSLYFFLKTINIVLDKQNYNKLIIYERSNFIVIYLFISIILYVYLSTYLTFIVSTSLFVVLWLSVLSTKKEIFSRGFIYELVSTFIFIILIVYVGFIKIMNTPFP
tara:strand:- start:233 stop:730 length:498 start_codon:yes stop_codon:yes gene_type:complete